MNLSAREIKRDYAPPVRRNLLDSSRRMERKLFLKKIKHVRNAAKNYSCWLKENLNRRELSMLESYSSEADQICRELKGVHRYSTQTIEFLFREYRDRVVDLLERTEELLE